MKRQRTVTVRIISMALLLALLIAPTNGGVATAMECASSIAPTSEVGASAVNSAYKTWKTAYVTTSGADGNMRVQRSAGDDNDTVSEGIAYGMLFAAYNNDKATFDGLWNYAKTHLNSNGFMNWRIAADGSTTGGNGATDADEDMAAALIAADSQWGTYRQDATTLISRIKKYEIEAGTNIVKPGDMWGGSNLLNPSYLAPAYYQQFAEYTGDSSWNDVQTASFKVLNAVRNNTASRKTGLIPDWSTATGAKVNGMGYDYSYDASRTPLRLAMSSLWTCDANANTLLTPFNATFQSEDLNKLATGYSLSGAVTSRGNALPFVAAAATAATTSSDDEYRSAAWNSLVDGKTGSYFPDSMRLFGLLVASGKMVKPTTLGAAATSSVATPVMMNETSEVTAIVNAEHAVSIWWPTVEASVFNTQPFKAVVAGMDVNDYTMYWQVDGGRRNLMYSSTAGYPHKQADVNVRGWNWQKSHKYTITFTAVDASGAPLNAATTSVSVKP